MTAMDEAKQGPRREVLAALGVAGARNPLPGWTYRRALRELTKAYVFTDGAEAAGFVEAVARAGKLDGGRVAFSLGGKDPRGRAKVVVRLLRRPEQEELTTADLELARRIDKLAEAYGGGVE